MGTFAYSNQDMEHCNQGGRKTSCKQPLLLPLLDEATSEHYTQSHISALASQINRLVAQRLPITAVSPLCWTEQSRQDHTYAESVYSALTTYLQQGFQRLLLVPWGGRQSTSSLSEFAHLVLSTTTEKEVSRTELALPHVHVDGVSVRSGFEGFASTQTQLVPLLEEFPGWDRIWSRLSAGDVTILLLRTSEQARQLSRAARWEMPTRKALTAALGLQQVGFMTASERSGWQQDGDIYARYLVSLLCSAIELLRQ